MHVLVKMIMEVKSEAQNSRKRQQMCKQIKAGNSAIRDVSVEEIGDIKELKALSEKKL